MNFTENNLLTRDSAEDTAAAPQPPATSSQNVFTKSHSNDRAPAVRIQNLLMYVLPFASIVALVAGIYFLQSRQPSSNSASQANQAGAWTTWFDQRH